ncbi:glycosyltransferase [Dactylosporangium sp. NPDC005555]|uniref:glycosyltransferase n=1 Tax=Dactylosporangium sp. NPDC005555 TaxID=3154889 RepID=UPI0033B2A067
MSEPKTVLFVVMAERSAASATLTLAKRLTGLGYRVLFTGPQHELFDDRIYGDPALLQPYLAAQGLAYEPLPSTPFTAPATRSRRRARRAEIRHHRRDMALMAARLGSLLAEIRPAVVVLDSVVWRYAGEAARLGIPVVNFNTSLTRAYNPSVPPAFTGLRFDDRPHPVRYRLAWADRLIRARHWEQVRPRIWPWSLGLLPVRSTIRRLRQLGTRIVWTEYGPRPVAPELVAAPRELDFPVRRETGNTRVYVGSCVDVDRRDEPFDWAFVPPDGLVLYCSMGTYSAEYPPAERLFGVVIEAARRLGCTTVIQAHIEPPAGLPENVQVVRAVPQLEALSRAHVFITHGGLSSLREACYFGVPMVVFPGWNDQPGNGARVEYHGLGLVGDAATVDVATMVKMIDEVRGPAFAAATARMREVFRAKADCAEGVDFLVAMAGRDGRDPSVLASLDLGQ